MNKFFAAAIAALSIALPAAAHDTKSHATYIGNEGVMVASGGAKILFDAFYSESYGGYTLVSDETSEAMLSGAAPYDDIDAIFVSHVHGDHFTAAPAIEYLRAQGGVILYGPEQVREAVEEAGVQEDDPLWARIKTYDMAPEDDPVTIEVDGLLMEAAAIPHDGGAQLADIQNFVWRVTLDDKATVMHLGDVGPDVHHFERHKDYFTARKTHMAFPPFWLIADETGRMILETYVAADKTVGIHVPASTIGKGDEVRAEIGGDVFTDPGETREIPEK